MNPKYLLIPMSMVVFLDAVAAGRINFNSVADMCISVATYVFEIDLLEPIYVRLHKRKIEISTSLPSFSLDPTAPHGGDLCL